MAEPRFIRPAHYRLEHVPEQDLTGQLVTAAVLDCALCGEVIDGSGGPCSGRVCQRCGELMQQGRTRGAVVWSEEEAANG